MQVSVAVAKSKGSTMTSTIEPSTASAIASMVTGGNQAAAAAAAFAAAADNPNSQESADYSQYWQYWSQYAAWNQYSNSSAQYEYEHVEQVEEDVSEYELIGKCVFCENCIRDQCIKCNQREWQRAAFFMSDVKASLF